MKLIIQRVSRASVEVEGVERGRIRQGLVLLLGIEQGDTAAQASQLAAKVAKLRLWPDLKDPSKQWASSVVDNSYMLLVISQFTLFATFKKPKPDFHQAMGGDEAKVLYETFLEEARAAVGREQVQCGVFGAMMQVNLINDGPVTVELVALPQARALLPEARGVKDAAPAELGMVSDGHDDVEARLEAQPYLTGFHPAQADAHLFVRISSIPETPNLARWYQHIASFTPGERAQWR